MASQSFPLYLSISSTAPTLTLRVGLDPADSEAPFVELEGQAINPLYQAPGTVLSPTVAPTTTPVPPLPDYLRTITYDPSLIFNHLELSRLQNKPSKVFNLTIFKTELLINGTDYSSSLYSLDWSTPIEGISQGSITLKETVGVNLNPDINGINQGDSILVKVYQTPTSFEVITNCFVIGFPDLTLNQEGTYELRINIGDELALLSNTTRNKTLYCGQPAKTTQELAHIYANINGLRTRLFPVGHDILEASTNNFITESPFEFLSAIYSPINRDVRTSANGLIICPTRQPFNQNSARTLTYLECIQAQNNFSSYYEKYTKVKASNDFNITLPFNLSTRTFKQVNGDPENTKPWFQGGYQELVTTITSLGDTDIYYTKETFGYVPTDATPWDPSLVNEDECAIGAFTTVFDTISKEINRLTYYLHPSDTYIVTKDETWKSELKVYQITDSLDPDFESYNLFNGLVEYQSIFYQHQSQVNVDVCEREYTLLTLNTRTENYAIDEAFNFLFKSWSQENYAQSGNNSTLGQTSFLGSEAQWTKSTVTAEFDDTAKIWVIQPPLVSPNENPPTARTIKPVTQAITNFSEYTLFPTSNPTEPKPLSAPFCYNKDQLDTMSFRYLTEQYGLSRSVVVVVPSSYVVALNDSIIYTDRLGQSGKYLVWDIEYNQTLKQMTKSLTLLRWYE